MLSAAMVQFGSRAHSAGRRDEVARLLSSSQGFRLLFVAPVLSAAVWFVADVDIEFLVVAVVFGIWVPAGLDGALFCMIIEFLVPLLIWLFWDLEQRRQRWLASRGRLMLLGQQP